MKPLEGIRIVELHDAAEPLAIRLAGGFAGRVLADFGAEVLYETPEGGDPLCRLPPIVGGVGASFAFLSAGKHPIARHPGAMPAALAGASAVILAAGREDRLAGLDGRAIVARLSLMGERATPLPGSEFTVMALSGVLDLVGDPNREPLRLGGHQAAYSAGLAAFTGLLAALVDPNPAGARPRSVNVNLLETMLWINWKSAVMGQSAATVASREGLAAEWQVIRCADGWVALVYQPEDWPALVRLVDDPRLDDERFATAAARLVHARELAGIIEGALMRYTRAQIRAEALARRLPLGPVWSVTDLLQDVHYRERGVFVPAALPDGSTAPMATLPLSWDGSRLLPGAIPGGAVA